MKIAIVMTYFAREAQLWRTLQSIEESKYYDFEVIIVDDKSPKPVKLPPVDYKIILHRIENKLWHNPEPAYNTGIGIALSRGAEIIIVQNAECFHYGDIISAATQVKEDQYISFACFSLNQRMTFAENINLPELIRGNNFGACHDGQNAWYNHATHRPVGYDFCAAMTRSTMLELNGYDERLSDGMAYGDDYLLRRVRMLGKKFTIPDNPFVVHQWHYTGEGVPANKAELVERNKKLFYKLLEDNNPYAVHTYTNDFKNITC